MGAFGSPPSHCRSPYPDRPVCTATEEAKDFFRHLRWILERKETANQDLVLIEHMAAWLVEAAALPD